MDYYQNAQETERAACSLLDNGFFRQSTYMFCLAVELYLKSKLGLVEHSPNIEKTHDIINMYKLLSERFAPRTNLTKAVTRCQKYFNESRYPYMVDARLYTEEFAKEFKEFAASIREYIEDECLATLDDLSIKFGKKS